jgi:ABC-type transport system substrate-binding protein
MRTVMRFILAMLILGGSATSCTQPPTPIVVSDLEATQRVASPVPTISQVMEPAAILKLGVVSFAGLDPLEADDAGTEQVQSLLYETLYGYDEAGGLQPLLAASLPSVSEDGLAWEVELLSGISFHDGTPLDALAAVNSLEALLTRTRQMEAAPFAAHVFQGIVASVSGVGLKLNFLLHRPYASFPELLAEPMLALIHGIGVGTGPFFLRDDIGDTYDFTLEAWPTYHGGNPAVASVQVHVLGEETTAPEEIADLVNHGTVDLIAGRGAPSVIPGEVMVVYGPMRSQWLVLNPEVAPLNQELVRLALAEVFSGASGYGNALANAGLPDGFDLVVWSTIDTAGVVTMDQTTGHPVNVSVFEAGVPAVITALEHPGRATQPGAVLIEVGHSWDLQWWFQAAGWDHPDIVVAPGIMLSSVNIVVFHRAGLDSLGFTSGGWPRITHATILQ